ncbi:hypothetical protein CKAH01_01379 [Colletotrichum kahawae]|uniref:Uncharacterized protein n=1 Tax=Colletotrichum kahawae TaxID=34407 RepID=A0AAE0D2E7_COLKA|nr:hypothetical protein CKAH01_01379 [Colletotrichum kahawae]
MAYFPPSKRGPGFRTISAASYSSSSTSSDESVDIPEDLNSKEFLVFAGFSEEKAAAIFQRWCNRGDRDELLYHDAIAFIKTKAEELDAVDEDDDWRAALINMGLSSRLILRILDPRFKKVRLTGCACSWALDTIQESFSFLEHLDGAVEKRKKNNAIERTDSPDGTKNPRPALRPQNRRTTGTSSSSSSHPTPTVFVDTAPTEVDGRSIFMKGGSETRFSRAVKADGSLSVFHLQSEAPTDFHPKEPTYIYLTKDREVAELYARYVEERCEGVKGVILQIAIPNDLVSDAREIFGNDWQELIWNSRNTSIFEDTLRILSPSIRHYESYDVLVSNLCTTSTHRIARMTSQSEIEAFRLSNGTKASQHVIQTQTRQLEIARQSTGFIWIIPYRASQIQGYRR